MKMICEIKFSIWKLESISKAIFTAALDEQCTDRAIDQPTNQPYISVIINLSTVTD